METYLNSCIEFVFIFHSVYINVSLLDECIYSVSFQVYCIQMNKYRSYRHRHQELRYLGRWSFEAFIVAKNFCTELEQEMQLYDFTQTAYTFLQILQYLAI